MKIKLTIIAILFLTIISCKQNEKISEIQKVDYKSDSYKIKLGESYLVSDKIIDWNWDAESDDDGVIDSTGCDSFMHLGEPFIQYNDEKWLPSLFISTEKNVIVSFTCSVLFLLDDTPYGKAELLTILSKDIKQLQDNKVKKSLLEKGKYEISSKGYIETLTLTEGKNNGYDAFKYKIRKNKTLTTAEQ